MLILPNYAQNYAGTIDSSLPRTHPWVLIDCIHPSLSTYGLPPSDKMVPKRWPRNLSKNWSKKGSKNWSKKWSKNSPIVQGSNSPVQIYTMSKSGTLGETSQRDGACGHSSDVAVNWNQNTRASCLHETRWLPFSTGRRFIWQVFLLQTIQVWWISYLSTLWMQRT